MQEQYKDIINYEGLYQVSNLGNVKRLNTNRILKSDISASSATEYHRVTLCKNGETKRFLVHRLVAMAFIPNPENKPEVNHIDNNGNNNTLTNLEWCTKSENMSHSRKQGRQDKVDVLRVEKASIHNIQTTDDKYTKLINTNINGRILLSYYRKQVNSRIRIIGIFKCANCSNIIENELSATLSKQYRSKPLHCRSCSLKKKI